MWNIGLALGLAFILLVPLSHKWGLRMDRVLPWTLGIGLVSGLLTWAAMPQSVGWICRAGVQVALIMVSSGIVLAWRFYRDPDRVPPGDPSAILSPADGRIVYVRRYEAGAVPHGAKGRATYRLDEFTQSDVFQGSGVIIGIGMSFLDVHVNRSPVSGVVRMVRRIPGRFWSLRRAEALTANERALIVIDCAGVPVGVVQIASRLVRQIVCYVTEGQTVKAGDRIGMIRFGSQVDLILPAAWTLEITCHEGDYVHAGLSILARRVAR